MNPTPSEVFQPALVTLEDEPDIGNKGFVVGLCMVPESAFALAGGAQATQCNRRPLSTPPRRPRARPR